MKRDTQIFDLIRSERQRQMHGIELIASENFVSDQVMEAMGSVLTNKYADGSRSGARRPPLARLAGQHVRQVFQGRRLSARRDDGHDRLRRHGAEGAGVQAQADRGRRIGLLARVGLQAHARNRRQGGCPADGGHGPHGRTDRRRRARQPREIRPYRNLDHPQDPARSARRYHPDG